MKTFPCARKDPSVHQPQLPLSSPMGTSSERIAPVHRPNAIGYLLLGQDERPTATGITVINTHPMKVKDDTKPLRGEATSLFTYTIFLWSPQHGICCGMRHFWQFTSLPFHAALHGSQPGRRATNHKQLSVSPPSRVEIHDTTKNRLVNTNV